jgi:CheY-like chemotaxis protein
MAPSVQLRRIPMSKRLLVVDDEPNLLRAVAACLKTDGYEVNTARSGHEALMQLAESVPDLIISDIRMPGMD